MQFRLLRHFLAAYNHLNITTAADALAITQPGLTKSIQHLEAELGVPLFDRLPNGVAPTRYGEMLAKHSTSIFLEYDHAIAEIAAMKGGAAGTIRIGAGPIWLTHFLPPAVAAFRVTHPGVKLSLDAAVISTAVPALLRGEIEIFCGSLDFPEHPEIVKREMDEIEHVVFASHDHPLAKAAEFDPAQLLLYPWAMLASDDVGRRQLSAYFASNGLPAPDVLLESSSIVCILQNVRQGDFLACLARPLFNSPNAAGLVELAGPGTIWRYQAGIAIRKRLHIPSTTNRFVDSVIGTYFKNFKPAS
jgi:DNA-binding transcriptional LysR family regulator